MVERRGREKACEVARSSQPSRKNSRNKRDQDQHSATAVSGREGGQVQVLSAKCCSQKRQWDKGLVNFVCLYVQWSNAVATCNATKEAIGPTLVTRLALGWAGLGSTKQAEARVSLTGKQALRAFIST